LAKIFDTTVDAMTSKMPELAEVSLERKVREDLVAPPVDIVSSFKCRECGNNQKEFFEVNPV
jgi:hypothetical protein